MSEFRRSYYAKKLSKLLSRANDEDFLNLVWAVDVLQSGDAVVARPHLTFPPEAENVKVSSPYAVHQWRMEDLVNAVLAVPKAAPTADRPYHILNCRQFSTLAQCSRLLGRTQDAADSAVLKRINILDELPRIAHKQFEWQIGFANLIVLYRSAFLFSGPACREYFRSTVGLEMEEFILLGMALRAHFQNHPVLNGLSSFQSLGLSSVAVENAVKRISKTQTDARKYASSSRGVSPYSAYQRSILREYPCILFGKSGERLRAPLSDLVFLRTTAGIYLDLVAARGEPLREIGLNFERYCLEILSTMLPTLNAQSEVSYMDRGSEVLSPDILIRPENEVVAIIECKATRMVFDAKFGENSADAATRGMGELSKGIVQIWRHVSACRRGLVPSQTIAKDVVGVLLTLDPWMTMSVTGREKLLALARVLAKKDVEITPADQCEFIVCPVLDMEQLLRTANTHSFVETLRIATTKKFQGWHIWKVHEDNFPDTGEDRVFPFNERIPDMLPWWKTLELDRHNESTNA